MGGIGACESLRIQQGWANPLEDSKNFQKLKEGYYPGDLGFDPLGLKPSNPEELLIMQNKELNNGRLAMIAAFGFMMQEAATGTTWGPNLSCETLSAAPWCPAVMATSPEGEGAQDMPSVTPGAEDWALDSLGEMMDAASEGAPSMVDADSNKFCWGLPGSTAPFPDFDPA